MTALKSAGLVAKNVACSVSHSRTRPGRIVCPGWNSARITLRHYPRALKSLIYSNRWKKAMRAASSDGKVAELCQLRRLFLSKFLCYNLKNPETGASGCCVRQRAI